MIEKEYLGTSTVVSEINEYFLENQEDEYDEPVPPLTPF
jgi:hypothetical protein